MLSHDQMKKKMLSNKTVSDEYEALSAEFQLADQLLKARLKSGLSQADVAERMGTKAPAVSRIESSDSKHSTSVRTLQKYAHAIGYNLEIKLRPAK